MGKGLLIMIGGLVVVTSFVQVNVLETTATVLPERNIDYLNEQAARNVTSSLIDNAIENIRRNNEWDNTLHADDHIPGEGTLLTITQDDIDHLPEGLSIGAHEFDEFTVLLYATSEYNGHEVATEVLLRRDSFSRYSYFSEDERTPSGQEIYFFDQDILFGPIHTNGTIRVAGNPVFNGFVSSPNDFVTHPSIPTNPEFLGGTNFNSTERPTPSSFALNGLSNAAQNGGLRFNRRIDVEFITETSASGVTKGKAKIREFRRGRWGEWSEYDLDDYNGVISSTRDISVRGEVKGNVSLYSESNIEILGDITYSENPLTNPNSDDLLGLISEGNVTVDANAHTYKGSRDLDLHASILALGDSFGVESFNFGGPRGNLNLLGGIVQRFRGPVGTFSGNNIASGYSKSYEYDERLRNSVPPFFPRESVFSVVYWKELNADGSLAAQ